MMKQYALLTFIQDNSKPFPRMERLRSVGSRPLSANCLISGYDDICVRKFIRNRIPARTMVYLYTYCSFVYMSSRHPLVSLAPKSKYM